MSRAKDLNRPEHWLDWLRAIQKAGPDGNRMCAIRGLPLGMITGTDAKVLRAIASLWQLCGYYPDDPCHQAALQGIRALLPCMQEKCWPFARELAAQALDWNDRDRLWPLVVPTDQRKLARELHRIESADGHPVGHLRVKPS